VAGLIEQPESEETNSLSLRLHTAARGAVCRSAGASSLGSADRSPDPFALADASAFLFRLSLSISGLNCLSAVAGNYTRWALIKASYSSFIISEWPDMQGSEFGLPALRKKDRSRTSESGSFGYAKSVNRLDPTCETEPVATVTSSQYTDSSTSFESPRSHSKFLASSMLPSRPPPVQDQSACHQVSSMGPTRPTILAQRPTNQPTKRAHLVTYQTL
jgi:hypothetical protein